MPETGPVSIEVEVVFALADRCWSTSVRIAAGATVAEALAVAGILWVPQTHRSGLEDPAGMAVFGRVATAWTRLNDGDRIELLRPLQADPKQARKQRAADAKRASRKA